MILNKRKKYKKYTREIQIMRAYLQMIYDLSVGYDGFENSLEGLKGLVDELRQYAIRGLELDDQKVVYVNGKGQGENIIFEVVDPDFGKKDPFYNPELPK